MTNVFSPVEQAENLEAKVVAGIERLATLFKSSLQDTAKQYKLTPLQAQLLIFIAEHGSHLCTVTMLAKEFSVSKPTASDSLKTLVNKQYIRKVDNPNDARAFSFAIEDSAKSIITQLTDFGLLMSNALSDLKPNELEQLYHLNLKMLNFFSHSGLIACRMCYSCKYYEQKGEGFYCHLMKAELPSKELRLDCPEHQENS